MNRKVLATIEKYHMLKKGDSVVVGCSGGADSVALLACLCALREEWRLTVSACHINHSLRGAESDADELFVRDLCSVFGVKLFCFTENIAQLAAQNGRSLELEAREYRYHRFGELAVTLNACVATAHTSSDNLETMLFNLARGTGSAGLCGIPPTRAGIIRPLIEITRKEVEAYCRSHSLAFRIDSSNLSDAFARNRLRHHAVPALLSVNTRAEDSAAALCETMRDICSYLNMTAGNLLKESRVACGWDADILRSSPAAVRHAALALLLSQNEVEVSRARIARLEQILRCGGSSGELRRDCCACVRNGVLCFSSSFLKSESIESVYSISDGTNAQFKNKTAFFLCDEYEHFKNIADNEKLPLNYVVDYDKIDHTAVVRTRRAGDCYSSPSRGWTKTLKKLFNEYGVEHSEREQRLVCADAKGVFWVEGFGPDRRAAADDTTRTVLLIRIAEESS